jgi:uroporphyrin-III C-methyltransferase
MEFHVNGQALTPTTFSAHAHVRISGTPTCCSTPTIDGSPGSVDGAAPSVPGTVYLVGAGPGAADLITLRGLRAMRGAGAVIYDALIDPVLLDEAPEGAELIFAGKRAGFHALSQDEINELLRVKAYQHARVVRLKGGDPFVFGRGSEEQAYLVAAGVPVEVVPGVSSAIAAPAAAGVPVTHRNLSRTFAVVTGHLAEDSEHGPDWHALARIDTLVVLMGLRKVREVTHNLLAAGQAGTTPAMIVAAATLPHQQTVTATLETLPAAAAEAGLPPDAPATLIIGEVVTLARAPAVAVEPFALDLPALAWPQAT